MTRRVEVVPYHSEWPALYAAEALLLEKLFGGQMLSIHHFGSTAVPGISAKPVIDILLIVREISAADALEPNLRALGYHAMGEYGIAGRRFFYKGTEDLRSHHLHIYASGNPNILRHLAFRDYMRSHPISARKYAQLKESLARQFPEDMDRYVQGKDQFVKEHEQKAMRWWTTGQRKPR